MGNLRFFYLENVREFRVQNSESCAKRAVKVPRNQERDKDAALLLPSVSDLQKDSICHVFRAEIFNFLVRGPHFQDNACHFPQQLFLLC